MAYDTALEERIDGLSADWGLGKKKMFGGLGYFLDGVMCFAVRGDELLLRVEADVGQSDELLKVDEVHVAAMGARPMKNWLQAGGAAIAEDRDLLALMEVGRQYALAHPK